MRSHLRTLGAVVALTCSSTAVDAATTVPAPVDIHIAGFAFVPQTVTLEPGQTIHVVNDDAEPHTLTSVDKSFDSGGLDMHESWNYTAQRVGTFAFYCQLHPSMRGTLVIRASAGAQR